VVALTGPSPFTNSLSLEATERGLVSVANGYGSDIRIPLFYCGGRIRHSVGVYEN
jgi:hypothetical protein